MEKEGACLDTDLALKPLLQAAQEAVASGSTNAATAATVRAIVLKVLSDPNVFCGFDQIKQVVRPVFVATNEDKLLKTLDLFSFGKYSDYKKDPSSFWNLNDSQIGKLRQLTALSVVQDICSQGKNIVPYDILAQELHFVPISEVSLRQVESVLVSCLYAQIIEGKLCQKSKSFILSSIHGPPCRARDINPTTSIPVMIATLKQLSKYLESSDSTLDQSRAIVQTAVDTNAMYWKSVQDRKKKAETQSSNSGNNNVRMSGWVEGAGGGPGGTNDAGRRSSASRRQSKRSRGGLSGSFNDSLQRF